MRPAPFARVETRRAGQRSGESARRQASLATAAATRSSVAVKATRTCCAPAGAVEVTGGDQDPALGEPGDRVPAGLVAAGPQVERRLGVVDAEAGRLQGSAERRTAGGVASVLLLRMCGVGERRGHRHLLGAGHHQPEVLADREQLPHQSLVARDERAAVAGQVGALGQGVHGEQPVDRVAADRGVQHRDGLRLPRALEVALVGDQDRAALAAPLDDLAQMVGRQHAAGRVGRRVQPQQGRALGPERGQRVPGHRTGTGQRRADGVRRVGELGEDDQVSGPDAEVHRQ